MNVTSSNISIITINLNNAAGLEKTIASVVSQQFSAYQFIVIDGNSTDGSVEVIKKYANGIHHWVSEKDNGIFNAMNKGIKIATGQYLLFLNSGDALFETTTLQKVYPHLMGAGVVYGDLDIFNGPVLLRRKFNEPLSFRYFIQNSLPHQAAFIKKELFDTHGLYDETQKICSDWKFFTEVICVHQTPVYYLDFIVTLFDGTGISSKVGNWNLTLQEKNNVLQQHYAYFMKDYEAMDQLEAIRNELLFYNNSKIVKLYTCLWKAIQAIKRKIKK